MFALGKRDINNTSRKSSLPDIVAMGKEMKHTLSLKKYILQCNLLRQRHYRTSKEIIKTYTALFSSFFLTEQ